MAAQATVIVASRGRGGDLARCVASILACDHPSFEVLVAEQVAPNGRPADLPADPRLRHLVLSSSGKSVALNEAIPRARGGVLLFTDDDCTVAPGWIRRAIEALQQDPRLGAVYGALEAAPHEPHEFVPTFLPRERVVLSGTWAFMRNGGAGANLAVPRRVLEAIGPWDEQLGPGATFKGLEEYDLFYRILRSGYAVLYDPANPVQHRGTRSYADGSAAALLRGYRFGEGAVLAKHLRCGDLRTLAMVGKVTLVDGSLAMRALLRTGRPTAARRLLAFLRGFAAGLRHPLDRRDRVFLPGHGRQQALDVRSTAAPETESVQAVEAEQ